MRFIIVAVILFNCAHGSLPAPPAPGSALDYGLPKCSSILPDPENICDGQFTQDGLACARCDVSGCFDVDDAVYCVKNWDCGDPLCSHHGVPGMSQGDGHE